MNFKRSLSMLEVVDERGAQQRLRVAVPVTGQLPPERDRLVDRRADRVRRAVQLGGVVRVRQVLEHRPEEAEIATLPSLGEGALAELVGRQRVQLGEGRIGYESSIG